MYYYVQHRINIQHVLYRNPVLLYVKSTAESKGKEVAIPPKQWTRKGIQYIFHKHDTKEHLKNLPPEDFLEGE